MKKQPEHKHFRQGLIATLGLVISVSILPISAQAAVVTWVGGSDRWDVGANWDSTAQPAPGDDAYLTQSDATNRVVSYYNTLYPNSIDRLNSLRIDATGTGIMTLNQTGNYSLYANSEYIGYDGTGAYVQSIGTNAVTSLLYLGYNSTGKGNYTLSGTGVLSASSEFIGYIGTGSFTQSGGSNTLTNSLILGQTSTANGSYDLSGTGALSARSEIIGNYGTGVFTQSGGTNTLSNTLTLGSSNATAKGSYTLSGTGTLSAGGETIGNYGTGTFTQSGGTNTVGNLSLGKNSTGNGSYDLSGTGVLSASNETIGYFGTGVFTQSGGTNTLTSSLTLGQTSTGNGSYDLGGTSVLSAGSETIGNAGTGVFTQSGGTNTVGNTLVLGSSSTGNGSYDLSGTGTLSAANEIIGDSGMGVFTQSGGTNTVTNNLVLGSSSTGNGTYTLSGGTLNVGGGIYLGGNSIAEGGIGTLIVGEFADVNIANEIFLYQGSILQMSGGTLVTDQLNGSGNNSAIFDAGSLTATNSGLVVGVGGLFGDQLILGNVGSNFSMLLGQDTFINSGATLTLDDNSSLTTNALANEGMVSGYGSVNGSVNGGVNSVFVASGGTLALGDTSSFNGFRTQGLIEVGADAITLNSRQFAQLGYQTNLSGGTLNAENGVFLSGANAIVGFGNVNAKIAAQTGSTISANGNLSLGDASKFDGFYSQGNLETNENTVTINDRNEAVLGSLTTLGNVNGAGTLQSANGLLLQQGNNLIGYGTVNGDFINQGYVAETSALLTDQIEFTGTVSGAGGYEGNVLFSGTFTPGNSPALVSFENIAFASGSTLIMEIGGLLAGSEYDVLEGIAGSTATLAGTLNVDLFDLGSGLFSPSLGDSFEILTAETLVGEFDFLTLAVLGGGLDWQLDYLVDVYGLTDIVRLSVVSAVPVPPAVWLFGSGLIGLIAVARRRRN